MTNLAALISVPVSLKLYLGNVLNESFVLKGSDITIYACAYGLPIVVAAILVYMLLPKDKEIHPRWKLLAILILVTFSFLAFLFVGNSPLGMEIDPWKLLAGHKVKVCRCYHFDRGACSLTLSFVGLPSLPDFSHCKLPDGLWYGEIVQARIVRL